MSPGVSLEVHPEAIAEARAAQSWYAERSAAAADAFLAEIDLAVSRILEAPHRWVEHHAGTRRYLLHRFPFSIVYHLSDGVIHVVAVAHGRRRPGYWKSRV
ncbi:MAG: type II toxin-antitoxin system RelE/ParE family toxin [bacterium]